MFRHKPSLSERIREAFHPTPVRKRVNTALHRLQVQLRRLEAKTYQLQARDRSIYSKCVAAIQAKNNAQASMYASECAEIRKMVLITMKSQLALERVALRLETGRDFGDIAYQMNLVGSVLSIVRNDLQNLMPDISTELADVNDTLQSVILEAGEATEQNLDFNIPTEESEKILREATALAEQKMRERFPEMPQIPTREPGSPQ
ncbi:MAG: Snf7 family protein [Candidatus Bathyarchaeia archaeon]